MSATRRTTKVARRRLEERNAKRRKKTKVPASSGTWQEKEQAVSQRRGLAIGFIAKYNVPTRWAMHMQHLTRVLPGGLFCTDIFSLADFSKDPSQNYASLRTDVVQQAKALNRRWLLFVDTDVFLPLDAVSRLMSHEQPIVSGIYWTKTALPLPVVIKKFGNGPIWKVAPSERPVPIEGSGLGCCLIDMEVFDAFDRAGIPYFSQNWVHKEGGREIFVGKGEDYHFFTKARELGFQAYADTNVLCDHYDENTDRFFPDESVLRKIRNSSKPEKRNRRKP